MSLPDSFTSAPPVQSLVGYQGDHAYIVLEHPFEGLPQRVARDARSSEPPMRDWLAADTLLASLKRVSTAGRLLLHSDLRVYLDRVRFSPGRERRMVGGLRVLQDLASRSALPITYGEFAERLQPGLAPIATAHTLEDIGQFCNAVGWPNVTCFVVSAATGECSHGFSKISSEDPEAARDAAWLVYAAYKTAPRVDAEGPGAPQRSFVGTSGEGSRYLEREFQGACERAVEECRALGYAPTAWIAMMHGPGGAVAAAQRLLRSGEVQSGFEKLIAMGRADLTVEQAVLEERWAALFSDAERDAARWRLSQGSTG